MCQRDLMFDSRRAGSGGREGHLLNLAKVPERRPFLASSHGVEWLEMFKSCSFSSSKDVDHCERWI